MTLQPTHLYWEVRCASLVRRSSAGRGCTLNHKTKKAMRKKCHERKKTSRHKDVKKRESKEIQKSRERSSRRENCQEKRKRWKTGWIDSKCRVGNVAQRKELPWILLAERGLKKDVKGNEYKKTRSSTINLAKKAESRARQAGWRGLKKKRLQEKQMLREVLLRKWDVKTRNVTIRRQQ